MGSICQSLSKVSGYFDKSRVFMGRHKELSDTHSIVCKSALVEARMMKRLSDVLAEYRTAATPSKHGLLPRESANRHEPKCTKNTENLSISVNEV